MAVVHIPSGLRHLTGGEGVLMVAGRSVRELLDQLEQQHPGLRRCLCDADEERLRSGLSVSVDGRVGALGLLQKVEPEAEVHFIPAIGGG